MAICGLKELKSLLLPRKRLLGLDHGQKRIGVAVSDGDLKMALPLQTIARTKFTQDAQQIARLITDFDIGGLVIGLPLNMDGSEGPRCQSVRHFGDNLLGALGDMPILFWDESLTSSEAESFLQEHAPRKKKQAVDSLAAAHILQGVLDALRRAG